MNKLTRRNFLKAAGVSGGGLVMGVSLSGCGGAHILNPITTNNDDFMPNAFIQVSDDNQVRFYCPRDEMGQGISTGLGTLVAEELDVSPADIDLRFCAAHADYDNPLYESQVTGGSTSMRAHYLQIRQAAANTRALLLKAAAAELQQPVDALETADGQISVNGQTFAYGQFVAAASQLSLDQDAPLKDKAHFRVIGKDFPRLDGAAKSTGTAVYGIDVDVDGMSYAMVKRCPVAGGSVASFEKSAVLAMPGVSHVLELDGGVAVVAESFWQAKKAVASLTVQWDLPKLAKVNSAQIRQDYQAGMQEEGDAREELGDVVAGFAAAKVIVEEEYWAPYLAHAPLEPMNALVHIQDNQVDVWTGTQAPTLVQGLVARHSGVEQANVRVHNAFMGGGFGRRAFSSHVIEATQLARITKRPIKLVWSREEDIQNGAYRPASLMKMKVGVNQDGKISAWSAKRVGANIMPDTIETVMPTELPTAIPNGLIDVAANLTRMYFNRFEVDHAGIEGLYEDYDVANRVVHHVNKNHGLPLTYWRSVGHSFTAFATESLIDELAEKANIDALEFRLNNTQANPRLNKVIELVAEQMNQTTLADGHFFGFAAHTSFSSYVAQAAEVSIEGGQIRVHKVICAVDCGQVVNPDIVRAQMEGAIMFGLTAALFGELEIENGAIKQSNFHDYPILRMNQAPAVDVIITESDEAPSGVGEPGVPPIAPAVANAVYAATGKRFRSLPLKLA